MESTVYKELEIIRKKSGGLLRPEDVVEFARDESTALHAKFEWDDTEAARQFRLAQAHQILRVAVIVHEETKVPIRAFVSLRSDRKARIGYRAMVDVLDDADLLAQLVEDAKAELGAFAEKFDSLRKVSEFAPVFGVADKIAPKTKKGGGHAGARTARRGMARSAAE